MMRTDRSGAAAPPDRGPGLARRGRRRRVDRLDDRGPALLRVRPSRPGGLRGQPADHRAVRWRRPDRSAAVGRRRGQDAAERADRAAVAAREAVPGTRTVSPSDPGADVLAVGDDAAVVVVYPPTVPGPDPYVEAEPLLEKVAERATADGGGEVTLSGFTVLEAGGGSDRGLIVEVLIGGIGALVVLALVFGSLLAGLPLLVAAVSILGTFLALLGLTYVTDVSAVVEYLDRPDRARCGHRLLPAGGHPLARGDRQGRRQRRRRARGDGHRRTLGALQRRDRRGLPGGAGSRADPVPAQHRPRRAADPAVQRRHLLDPGAGTAERGRAEAELAATQARRDPQPPVGGDRHGGAAPPVAGPSSGRSGCCSRWPPRC